MQIDLNNCALYRGLSQCQAGSDGLPRLSRMSAKLAQLYDYSEAAAIRAACASGVRLLFETDAASLELAWRNLRLAREVDACDIEVAGESMLTVEPEELDGLSRLSLPLPGKGRRQVTIYLPHLLELQLEYLRLEAATQFKTVEEKRPRLLLSGDSILQGMTTSSPAKAYGTALARALNMDYLNIAVGGALMNGAVARAAAELDWDMALLAFGVNDCSQQIGLQREKEETEASLQALCSPGRKVLLFTPLPWPGEGDKNLQEYIDCQLEVASRFPEVTVLQGYHALGIEQENFIDSCHPNDLGNQRIAEYLAAKVKASMA
ncbi:MAG: SGNH/GDSL hydrolase family protein [Lentisphaerae bacterium]|nr:SGNH/GDSL hydrolase family protein [Lentisphaerota bacterium]